MSYPLSTNEITSQRLPETKSGNFSVPTEVMTRHVVDAIGKATACLSTAIHRLSSHTADHYKRLHVMQSQLITEVNTRFAILARDLQMFRLRLRRTVAQTTRRTISAELDVSADLPRAAQLSDQLDSLKNRTKEIEVDSLT